MQKPHVRSIMHWSGATLSVVCLALAGLTIGVGHFSMGSEGALAQGLQAIAIAPFVYLAFRFGGWAVAELAGKPDTS